MKENQGAVVPPTSPPANPIEHLQVRFKELETGFRTWLAKQPLHVEAAVVTATSAAQGAAIGGLLGTLTPDAASTFPTPPPQAAGLDAQALTSFKQAQAFAGGPLAQARNFAVMTGVNAGISCVMRRLRGLEDVQNSWAKNSRSHPLMTCIIPKLEVCWETLDFRIMRRTSRKAFSQIALCLSLQIVLLEMSISLLDLGFSFLITFRETLN
ncbi:chloroplastic import inner membrane translocase subunit HP30-2-like isoform X2 [Phoenix dactylifera]|uniref:Chloroplastic import inner membrane translocase subunit HP30-2-like isoform X2 n=1 Tax=Phoenix dactylifera TaxID=42345 RepID=A0A8B7BYQ5_PHODC|nr:chloroplastic import inner membrane translocase subunit HP30-2-like isoform X2 [Phoenix dactylifera]